MWISVSVLIAMCIIACVFDDYIRIALVSDDYVDNCVGSGRLCA